MGAIGTGFSFRILKHFLDCNIMKLSVITLAVLLVLTVDYATSQTTGYVAGAGAAPGGAGRAPHVDIRVVPATQGTSPNPTTAARVRYLYEPHSCPKMDVATWENEVVIYDNKNCAIIVRMNPRLRRPTVTFQAPYW